jgi:hypothetical protein
VPPSIRRSCSSSRLHVWGIVTLPSIMVNHLSESVSLKIGEPANQRIGERIYLGNKLRSGEFAPFAGVGYTTVVSPGSAFAMVSILERKASLGKQCP